MEEWKRSGQIPAFGNWDMANDLPITQYFECARQAGLVRFSSSSGESADRDLYTPDSNKNVQVHNLNRNKNNNIHHSNHNHNHKHKQATRNRERRWQHGGVGVNKENGSNTNNNSVNVVAARKQGRVYDVVLEQPVRVMSKQLPPRTPPRRAAKPVDEDLYKIPPELLHTTKRKRKKMLGFISKCLVPAACVS